MNKFISEILNKSFSTKDLNPMSEGATVIQFPNKRKPTNFMTPEEVERSVNTITNPDNAAKWNHPELSKFIGSDFVDS